MYDSITMHSKGNREILNFSKKTLDLLSGLLAGGIPQKALTDYLRYVRGIVPPRPVISIDDSDAIKPEGYHVKSLGIVWDSSALQASGMDSSRSVRTKTSCVFDHPTDALGHISPRRNCLRQPYLIVVSILEWIIS